CRGLARAQRLSCGPIMVRPPVPARRRAGPAVGVGGAVMPMDGNDPTMPDLEPSCEKNEKKRGVRNTNGSLRLIPTPSMPTPWDLLLRSLGVPNKRRDWHFAALRSQSPLVRG